MKLSDVMGSLDSNLGPQIAMLLFLGAFGVIIVRTFRAKSRAEHETASMLPLEDELSTLSGAGSPCAASPARTPSQEPLHGQQ